RVKVEPLITARPCRYCSGSHRLPLMRSVSLLSLAFAIGALVAVEGQQPGAQGSGLTLEQVVTRIHTSESDLAGRMAAARPIVEIYAQSMESHPSLGAVPVRDEYILGQFEYVLGIGPTLKRLTPERGGSVGQSFSRLSNIQLQPNGFASMALPD